MLEPALATMLRLLQLRAQLEMLPVRLASIRQLRPITPQARYLARWYRERAVEERPARLELAPAQPALAPRGLELEPGPLARERALQVQVELAQRVGQVERVRRAAQELEPLQSP